MANDTNLCVLTGRLGKDAETRFMPNGNAVTNFSMAVGRSWKDQQGDWQEKTTWIDCTLFGKSAEHYGPKLLKGSQWLIQAEFSIDEWEKEGQKQRRPKFIVSKIQAIGGKATGSGDNSSNQGSGAAPGGGAGGGFSDFPEDDIPFAAYAKHSEYLV